MKINRFQIEYFVLIFSVLILQFSFISNFGSHDEIMVNKPLNVPKSSQDSSISKFDIEISVDPIIFFKGHISLKFYCDKAETLFVIWQLIEYNNGSELIVRSFESEPFYLDHGNSFIDTSFFPPLNEFSQQYSLRIIIFRFDTSIQSFVLYKSHLSSVLLYMGPIYSGIFLSILFLSISIFIFTQEKINTTPNQPKSLIYLIWAFLMRILPGTAHLPNYASRSLENIPYGKGNLKIHCPECKNMIIEGSAFCPYCGYHLREFERYRLI